MGIPTEDARARILQVGLVFSTFAVLDARAGKLQNQSLDAFTIVLPSCILSMQILLWH